MIEVEELRKDFVVRRGRLRRERQVVQAVNGISFRVEKGELLGYLGPNGAGKSTTMRMVAGLDRPTAGRLRVNGRDYRRATVPMAELGLLLAPSVDVLAG